MCEAIAKTHKKMKKHFLILSYLPYASLSHAKPTPHVRKLQLPGSFNPKRVIRYGTLIGSKITVIGGKINVLNSMSSNVGFSYRSSPPPSCADGVSLLTASAPTTRFH